MVMLLCIIMVIVIYNRIVFQFKNKDIPLLFGYLIPLVSRAAWQPKLEFCLSDLFDLNTR